MKSQEGDGIYFATLHKKKMGIMLLREFYANARMTKRDKQSNPHYMTSSTTHRHGSWRLCVLQPSQPHLRHPLIKPRHGHQLYPSMHRRRSPRICVDSHFSAPEQAESTPRRDPRSLSVAHTFSTSSRVHA
ncbi:hypothetical protein PIB30_091402 [Stylosanthes scabra]|uniref:Uncharacterized protein n=1 Tax=Stylosanthes scabra TaxID=79078 RepID=A0ABU6UVN6_9FABA|nr:hypothetical protein [Stylosanthes scabra]